MTMKLLVDSEMKPAGGIIGAGLEAGRSQFGLATRCGHAATPPIPVWRGRFTQVNDLTGAMRGLLLLPDEPTCDQVPELDVRKGLDAVGNEPPAQQSPLCVQLHPFQAGRLLRVPKIAGLQQPPDRSLAD